MDDIKKQLLDADPFKSWWPFIIAGIVFVASTIRTFMAGRHCPNSNTVNGQLVIITGANSGIGIELCKDLMKRNARIIMACRDMESAEQVRRKLLKDIPKAEIVVRYLDLRSFDCVRRFVQTIENEYDKIDILINNAGINFLPYEKTTDGYETHLQSNYLGHFLLSHLMIPLLKKSEQGRIINVSAHAYQTAKMTKEDPLNIGSWAPTYHQRDAFSHSKLAIVMATQKLAEILKESTLITVNSCTPGLVRGTSHLSRSPIMKALCAKIITFPWMWLFMKTPCQGAQTIIHLASDPTLKDVTGEYYNDCEKSELTDFARDRELIEKLYADTVKAVRIREYEK